MNMFTVVKFINVLYVVGIVAIAIFNNVIQINPEGDIQNGLIVVLLVLLISIPKMLSVSAVSPKLKLGRTTVVLNVVCLFLFAAGLSAYEQERLAIYWGVTVISICALNITVLISALVSKRESQSEDDDLVYP